MSEPIPDEALQAAVKAAHAEADRSEIAVMEDLIEAAVEAAAPFIARAAQVAILQEMATAFDECIAGADEPGDIGRTVASMYAHVAQVLSRKADELEEVK